MLEDPVSVNKWSHAGEGRGGSLGYARGCGAVQQRASAPGRVQCVSQLRQNEFVRDVVPQHETGAASSHVTGASVSGKGVRSNQPTAGIEKEKVQFQLPANLFKIRPVT